MTAADWERLIASANLPGMRRVRLKYSGSAMGPLVTAVLKVRDREPPHARKTIRMTHAIPNGKTLEGARDYLRRLLWAALAHEVDEHLLFDGVRHFDPHAPARP